MRAGEYSGSDDARAQASHNSPTRSPNRTRSSIRRATFAESSHYTTSSTPQHTHTSSASSRSASASQPTSSPSSTAPSKVRIRGLDGLRALAAALVLAYHFFPDTWAAGFIGVDVFFVLSGFLITALLLREYRSTSTIAIKAFLVRRYRRLLPAVAVATLAGFAIAAIVSRDAIVQAWWQILGALTGTYNWFELAHHSSYFNQSSPFLLSNMWSLAVEQQFYLVWPFLVLVLVRLRNKFAGVGVTLALAAASAVWSAVLVALADHGDVTRAYVGTDSHFFGLAMGAALAFALPGIMDAKGERKVPNRRDVWAGVGAGAAILLPVFAVAVPDGRWLYPWGMLAASGLAVLVIRAMLPDMAGSPVTHGLWAFFDSTPMRWLGERSYGIYLWHWPLIVIFHYGTHLAAWQSAILVTVLAIHLADLSYTHVESPIRKEGFLAYMKARVSRLRPVVAIIAGLALVAALAGILVASPATTQMQAQIEAGQKAAEQTRNDADTSSEASENSEPEKKPEKRWWQLGGYPDVDNGANVVFIGDSLGAGTTPSLLEMLPDTYVDAVPYRQFHETVTIAQNLDKEGKLRPYVAVWAGTNAGVKPEQLEDLLAAIGPDRFLVITTLYAPDTPVYEYVQEANKAIIAFAEAHPEQVHLARWDEMHPEIANDGIHPGPPGYRMASAEIVRAINSWTAPAEGG